MLVTIFFVFISSHCYQFFLPPAVVTQFLIAWVTESNSVTLMGRLHYTPVVRETNTQSVVYNLKWILSLWFSKICNCFLSINSLAD